ncbi:hypothetical protein M408DRAFT_27066 [Serendipita vermifera MAFF 305830]|uniref:PNPLA domain-containing protein n=1 Tax=Serendipita vermifera MAFF 305830 TaxID=933852 RepID=A0A0C2WD52_SERVB|nr:hypothetical protein M408DRAFT_27066 [Serendipita vermifera MAFF 305830]
MSGSSEETDGICILSFDNGGPGTYSQLLILKEQMSRLASDLHVGEDEVYPADYYDLMGGVGLGGLIAIMLGPLRMNVDEAIDGLLDVTSRIFPDASSEVIDREVNTKNLSGAVEDILQAKNISLDTKMKEDARKETRCKVALYAANSAHINHPQVFRTYSSRGSSLNPTILDAVCATISIPSHFLPVKIGPPRRQQSFVGNVIGANNPTRLLLEEASKLYGKDRRVTQIISLGGGLPRVLSVNSSDEEDVDKLLKDIMADCEVVANELSTRLFNIDAYLRVNVSRGMETVKIQEWYDLGVIEAHTASHLASTVISEALEGTVRRLQERAGTVTLGQFNHISSIKVTAKRAPPVSPHFVLRQRPWDTMVKHLVTTPSSRQKILPITGMGGCGKTQIVSYFLREYPDLYAQTIYVDASSSSNIKAHLQTWARTLGDGHERDVWEDAMRSLNTVPHGEQWILIFDNADDPELNLSPFLPTNMGVTIIITSRNHTLGNLSTTTHLELGEMTADEALKAMLQAARCELPLSDEEMHSSMELLEELGCLAVAVVQAGTYCHQFSSSTGDVFRPYTFTQYLGLFKSHRAGLMKKAELASLDDYQRGVYTTLDLSYKALPEGSQDLLHILSLFHYTDIPLAAFARAAENGFTDPKVYHSRDNSHETTISKLKHLLCQDMEWNELHIHEIIHTLRSFSLITPGSMSDSLFLYLHPLVQAWCRDMDSVSSRPYRAMVIQLLTSCGSEDIELNRQLLPHMIEMLSQVELQEMHVNDLMTFGPVILQQGHYRRAGTLFETAMLSR